MAGFPGGGMRVHAGLEKACRPTQPAMIASPPESVAFPPEPIPGGIRFHPAGPRNQRGGGRPSPSMPKSRLAVPIAVAQA